MKENVGDRDRAVRAFAGPAMMAAAWLWVGGQWGEKTGLAGIAPGARIRESAITRTCLLNAVFGIETR